MSPIRDRALRVLLVGPYDPTCGEYTFFSPPLGVWRLAGFLEKRGIRAEVFDANCCEGDPLRRLDEVLAAEPWDIVGFSTTGMTLRFDLSLAHQVRRRMPNMVLIVGGMEATFDPAAMFRLGPFDLVVLGEGEMPLDEVVRRVREGAPLTGIPGTVSRRSDGTLETIRRAALSREELRDAIFCTPYERMPFRAYWEKLERAYRLMELPMKAEREARIAEIRSIRLITLNYCPMGCTFCSSTNFLNDAQGTTARVGRLDPSECMQMLRRITAAYPDARTVIFQDDIFVFPTDHRILPLCELIVQAKERGEIPRDLQFISTNRIDAMTRERLVAMRRAGFRVLGFGIENFSRKVLREFRKERIHEHIRPVLRNALRLGITPFLDMILTSPNCTLEDLVENIRQAYAWTLAGSEVGMYPYVIPFSGAALANDPALKPYTLHAEQRVPGTDIVWNQPAKIPPIDPTVREAILSIEAAFLDALTRVQAHSAHVPSRARSLLWVLCAVPVLASRGYSMPDREEILEELLKRLGGLDRVDLALLRSRLRMDRVPRYPIAEPTCGNVLVSG